MKVKLDEMELEGKPEEIAQFIKNYKEPVLEPPVNRKKKTRKKKSKAGRPKGATLSKKEWVRKKALQLVKEEGIDYKNAWRRANYKWNQHHK